MELTDIEKQRYDRHIRIADFSECGQLLLKKSKVLVIGAGGLGCPVIQYLVAAGVGKIAIVDADTVSLSNLQRQILYSADEIGISKAMVASLKMKKLNAHTEILVYNQFLNEALALEIFGDYDLVVGCTDSYHTRYLIDRASMQAGVPFVHGAIKEFEGQFSVFNYKGSVSYADIFGPQPSELTVAGGVIGAIPGIIGSLMALEVVKILSNTGKICSDKLILYNGLENSFVDLKYV